MIETMVVRVRAEENFMMNVGIVLKWCSFLVCDDLKARRDGGVKWVSRKCRPLGQLEEKEV